MRIYAAAVYAFLYSPIALIVLFSFNAGRSGTNSSAARSTGIRTPSATCSWSRL
jgi:ABC-type spermidine/putrescine transport system permease subunit II